MHGDVVLEHSETDKGSTFLLTLPLAAKNDVPQHDRAVKHGGAGA